MIVEGADGQQRRWNGERWVPVTWSTVQEGGAQVDVATWEGPTMVPLLPAVALKQVREALCGAQGGLGLWPHRAEAERWSVTLGVLISQIDVHRPLGSNGKHGNLHTATCGCEDKS